MPSVTSRELDSVSSSGTSTPVFNYRRKAPEEKVHDYLLTKKELKASKFDSDDSIKRYTYLLGLTDLFRHFVDIKAKDDSKFQKILREVDRAHERDSKKKRAKQTRRRKTEREEDAELLNDEEEEPHTTVFTESPSFVEGTLRDYQIQGLNWLISLHENSISGILADEMGLGKTLQTISFLGYLRYVKDIEGPHIVIVPKSTLDNWVREFNRWIPEIDAFVLHGDKESRADLIQNRLLACDFDVCISSYEMIIREKAQLKKIAWQYIIVDEAHRIKNEDSMLSQIIRVFHSRNRLLITGTPLQNNLHELWALLNFLLPDVFSDSQVFDDWFEGQGSDQDSVVQQLHKVLSPFLLRRVKADVEKSLLPKKEVNLYVGMTEMQVLWYRRLLEKDIDAVNGAVGKREGKTRLLNIVMQLRKCCNHPYLFEGAEPGPPYTTDEHLVDNAGKMQILDKLLKQMKQQGSRVLIFSQMSRMLDILEDYCMFRDFEYCRIDGSTNHEDRIAAIDDYNKEGSDKFIFLLTTRAGGLGINLTTADIVVLYDSDWNPQADLQAMDRAHRIGQTKQVQVFRFITEKAIEEKVLERAAQKLRLDQLVIQQGRAGQNQSKNQSTSKDELLNMIQHGAKDVLENEKGTMTEDSIEDILRRGEARTQELNAKYAKLGLDDLQRFTSDVSAYQWDGQDFAKKNKGMGVGWIGPTSRRAAGPTSYNTNAYFKDRMKIHARTPRAPKQVLIQDFQFFDPRLKVLQERELNYHRKVHSAYNEDPEEVEGAEPLTEEEEELKHELENSGFTNWSKRDFTGFVHQAAKHGRDNYQAIAEGLESKTAEEIEAYSKAFWERYSELEGYERYVSQITTGEKRAQRLDHQQDLLRQKIEAYKAPMSEMHITYPVNNAKKIYSEEEDRFLLLQVNELGLNADNLWEKVRDRIKKSPLFKFDWFFLSRTPVELSRRCTTLLLAVTREFDGPLAMKRKSGPRPKNRDPDGQSDTPASAGSPMDVSMDEEGNDSMNDSTLESRDATPQPPPAKRQKKTRTDVIKSMETSKGPGRRKSKT